MKYEAVDPLQRAFDLVKSNALYFKTLNPKQKKPTAFPHLLDNIPNARPEVAICVSAVIESVLYHFPENIFWDFDYMAQWFASIKSNEELKENCQQICLLQKLFGRESLVYFRYSHDFLYGFDWARWITKDPQHNHNSPPYSEKFMSHLEVRSVELSALIQKGDKDYFSNEDKKFRNPFKFDRKPQEETLLFTKLAAENDLPFQPWETNGGVFNWQKDYTAIREKYARDIGIGIQAG